MAGGQYQAEYFIGLMSGTSLDSIDAAIIDLSGDSAQLIATHEQAIGNLLQQQLVALCEPGDNEIDRMGRADIALAKVFAAAACTVIDKSGLKRNDIRAIGSHGQTIRHRPDPEQAFTLQIADPNTIAQQTGITTVADFRRRDMAAGGQGAPLAPAFHHAMFSSRECTRVIINIGGIANITLLTPDTNKPLGYDTGPGNGLMDRWINCQQNRAYDKDGQWAATGTIDEPLLATLLKHPYLNQAAPKSTGREDFNLDWLQQQLAQHTLAAQDVQATLLEFTALTISNELAKLPGSPTEAYVCGGGAHNKHLMARLSELLSTTCSVASTAALGIAPEWVEAAAFGWLAKQTMAALPGNLPSVTGADQQVILGAIYQA